LVLDGVGRIEEEAAFVRARRRAASSAGGVGAALVGPWPDGDVTWRAVVVVVDNGAEAIVVVRSSTHAPTEIANPELVAEIVEEAVTRRGDRSLPVLSAQTAGILLEDYAPELLDAVFLS
jgi:hypothetical protein